MTEVRIRMSRETHKQLEEVLRRAFRAGDLPMVKRVTALLAVGRGEPVATIAVGIGVRPSTVYGWLHQFLTQGVDGLRVRWCGGRPAKLTPTQRERLAAIVRAGPEAAGFPTGRLSPGLLRHQLAVVDVAAWMLARHRDGRWVTERELRRDGMAAARGRRDGRLLDGVPHVPDGLLVDEGGRRVAIEVELSSKRRRSYDAVLRWYAGALTYDQVQWFAGSEAICQRLNAAIRRHRLDDLVTVEVLPPDLRDRIGSVGW
ncbi:MAG: helix-turn-helix domain-containing protein [Chloroflexi bacterium]|nr:helix-turn-helix domain-containing protein [Chloroflexota bacterium]